MAENITRRLKIYINGQEIDRTLTNIRKEYRKAQAQLNRAPINSPEWEKAGRTVKQLGQELKTAREEQGRFYDSARKGKSLLNDGLSFFGLTSGAILFTDAIKGAINWTKEFIGDSIEIAERAKGIDAAFKLIEGASDILADVRRQTGGLIADLDIKSAINQFKAFNLDLSQLPDLLQFTAQSAKDTGADFDNMFNSLVEGLSKESKLRIDNLGISQKALNDELEKTPDFVQAVANIAKRELKTAAGITDENSNAVQRWNVNLANAQERIGKLITNSGLTNWLAGVGASMLEAVVPTRTLREEFEDQAERVLDLEAKLPPLIEEYETLTGKSELTKAEQDRLKTVIGEVASIVPTAITQFDEYGNALDISSEKAREFIEVQKSLLQYKNQEAIKQQTADLEDYRRELDNVNKALDKRNADGNLVRDVTTIGSRGQQNTSQIELTPEEISQLQARAAALQNTIAAVNISIEELSGDALDKYVEREKAKTAAALKAAQDRANALGLEYENLTTAEINALIKKEEALRAAREEQAEKDAEDAAKKAEREAERQKEKDERELERQKQKLIDDKIALEETLAEFEADRALQKELEKLEEEQRAEEEEIAMLERKFEKLTEQANNEKDLLTRLEEEKLAAIEDIRKKYAKKRAVEDDKKAKEILKNEKAQNRELADAARELQEARADAYRAGIVALQGFFDKTTGIYKALFIAEKLVAAGSVILKGVEEKAKINATYAGIPGGQVIAAALTTAAQIRTLVNLATIAATTIQGFAMGGPTENAPTIGLDGPRGPIKGYVHDNEYVIPEFVRKDPEVPQIIGYLENKRQAKLRGFEEGGDASSVPSIPMNGDALASAINNLVENGVYAITLIGDRDIEDMEERKEKLKNVRTNAKINE